ncbi:MAG: SET domain-containing protein-lysine N-methyltransferase [Opitutus sp.]|nr:SET domain-containing protein-lysine N-methyltransferase [Opitutus sp.]
MACRLLHCFDRAAIPSQACVDRTARDGQRSLSGRIGNRVSSGQPGAHKLAGPRARAGGRRRGRLPATLRLGRSGVHGWGVFARDFIPEGERVIEYVGERITKAEAERRDAARLARLAAGGDGCVYVFETRTRHDIDGGVTWNPARRINHSCAPNCEAEEDDHGRIWIVARRDLAPGEELTYDYGFSLEEWRGHPCRCGAPECVGYIVARGQRWRVRRVLAAAARP